MGRRPLELGASRGAAARRESLWVPNFENAALASLRGCSLRKGLPRRTLGLTVGTVMGVATSPPLSASGCAWTRRLSGFAKYHPSTRVPACPQKACSHPSRGNLVFRATHPDGLPFKAPPTSLRAGDGAPGRQPPDRIGGQPETSPCDEVDEVNLFLAVGGCEPVMAKAGGVHHKGSRLLWPSRSASSRNRAGSTSSKLDETG